MYVLTPLAMKEIFEAYVHWISFLSYELYCDGHADKKFDLLQVVENNINKMFWETENEWLKCQFYSI